MPDIQLAMKVSSFLARDDVILTCAQRTRSRFYASSLDGRRMLFTFRRKRYFVKCQSGNSLDRLELAKVLPSLMRDSLD